MKFLIKPIHENALEMYTNHSTFHVGDSGLDLFIMEDQVIPARQTKLVDLGIQTQLISYIHKHNYKSAYSDSNVDSDDSEDDCLTRVSYPKYYSYLLYPRSSIAKTPLRVANSIGLIDAGYLGNLKVALWNTSDEDFSIKKGERYVQLVRGDLGEVSFQIVNQLRETSRKDGGFGSTGQ